VDGVGVVAEVVGGQLLQRRQLGVDLRGARGVGSAGIGVPPRSQAGGSLLPLIGFHADASI
jgi:hypothetical protein